MPSPSGRGLGEGLACYASRFAPSPHRSSNGERGKKQKRQSSMKASTQPDSLGHWGRYGGRFVPETLMAPLEELTAAYEAARADEAFHGELDALLGDYAGRPTPLFFAQRLTEQTQGAHIYLKREDLLH